MILDTCALLWLAEGTTLSSSALNKINTAPIVYVSAITAFEIALKYRQGKLDLPAEPRDWFKRVLVHHNLEMIDISLEIALKSTILPQLHKDPADRFIIATALLYKLPVVTKDKKFTGYGVKVID